MANKPISKFQEWFSKSIKGKVIKPTQLWSLDKGLDDDEYAFDQRGAVKIYGPTSFLKNKNHRGVAEMKFKGMGEVGASNGLSIPRPGSGKFVDSSRAMDAHFGWVYAAIKAIADEVSNIEFKLYEIDKAGEHGEVLEHELLDLLGGVNDFQTGPEFRHTLISHLELTGNAYIYLMGVINFNSKPKGMFLLNPSRMKVKLNQMSYPYKVVGYEMTLDGRIFQYQPYEIIHIKYPDPSDPWHGLGTVQGIAEWIDNDNYATEFLRQFFSNGARIMGIFETDMTDEEQLQELKDSFEERYAGVKNAYKTMAMPKGVKFIPVQQNLTDIGLPQLTENARDRILAGFRVSKTILGTAESDTNRATAETADYVFSKRTIKPKMQLIISYLNEFLVPRYDDKIYLAFVDPVPEDKAFRTTEMQAAVGQKQVITQNEAREEFMGLGPVDEPAADTITAPATPAGGDNAAADDDNNGDAPPTPKKLEKKTISKDRIVRPEFRKGAIKTQFSRNAVKRQEIFSALTEKMKELVEKAKKKSVFEMTDIEYAEVVLKDSTERGNKAEKELIGKIKEVNDGQKKEVMDNIKKYFSTKSKKTFKPSDIFNLKNWINILVDATTPVISNLFKSEATDAAAGVGKPELDVFNTPAAQTAIKSSVGLMAQSYNETTLATLTEKLNEGLSAGYGYQQTADLVSDIYTWQDDYAALRVAKTETVRIMNTANKTAWQQSGVVETLKWYTSPLDNVCEFCKDMDGTTIDINDNFFNQGDALTLDDGSSMSMDYSDIGGPPLHPNAVLEGTSFASYGKLNEMVGADYEGPAILIQTANNYRLPIGPNHPILTQRGMICARDLTISDYLVYDSRFDDATARIGIESNLQNVPFVQDAFKSISSVGSKTLIPASSNDLHGDGICCKGEIEIVKPTDGLLFKLDSGLIEKFREGNFVRTDMKPIVLSGNSSGDLSFDAVGLSTSGGVSGALSCYRFIHIQSIHYVNIKCKAFDATTETSLYNSNGFVVSNCNCRLRPDKISSVISGLPAPKNPEDEMLDKAIDEINHA